MAVSPPEWLSASIVPEAQAITVTLGLVDKSKLRIGHWLHAGPSATITVCITDANGVLADAHFEFIARAW